MVAAPTGIRLQRIETADHVRLAVHRVGPENGTPVVLVPGTFSNHTFWLGTRGTGLALALAAAGFDAWVLDPRGHGASQRPGPHDRWDFDSWTRQDVPAALRAATAERRRPAFLIGHSAGGAAVLAALAAAPELRELVPGLVIAGTPLPWLQPWRGLGARLFRRVSLTLGRFPARLLGLGPEDELPGVMAQWMQWNLQRRWRGEDGIDYEARFPELRAPVLFLAGAADRFFAPPAACRALCDRIGSSDKTFLVCGRDSGFSEDLGHTGLLVHRAARAEVWPRILAWLTRHAP